MNNQKRVCFIDEGVNLGKNVEINAYCSVLSFDKDCGGHLQTTIKDDVVIEANSIIYPGVTIGLCAWVKPGSVVTRSVPPLAIVQGNPATIIGYRSTHKQIELEKQMNPTTSDIEFSSVRDVTLHNLPLISDLRGDLSVGEFEKQIPLMTKRYFLVFGVPTAETRGEHAHKACEQFLICIKGSCKVIADDGYNREEFVLDRPNKGLYLPPMTWGIQYQYSQDAILLVFASDYYDANDYIRDYDDFIKLAHESQG